MELFKGFTDFIDLVLEQQQTFVGLSDEELRQLQERLAAEIPRLEVLADAVPGGNADRWALRQAEVRLAATVIALLDWETPFYGPFPPEIGSVAARRW